MMSLSCPRAASPEFENVFQVIENALSYVLNSLFKMIQHPATLKSADAKAAKRRFFDAVGEQT